MSQNFILGDGIEINNAFDLTLQKAYLQAMNSETIENAMDNYETFGIVLEVNDGKVSSEYVEKERM